MAGFHCTECIYGSFAINKETGMYQGSCSGYTLKPCPRVQGARHVLLQITPDDLCPLCIRMGRNTSSQQCVCDYFCDPWTHGPRAQKQAKGKF